MQDLIFQVIIPEETVVETKADGSKKEKVRKMFPGYIFVEMIVTDDSWFIVRNTPKVTGFLGSSGGGTKPVPLPHDEINIILKKIGKLDKKALDFAVGDTVVVCNGPLNGQTGEVGNIDNEKEKVTVFVEMFGRKTPIELEFDEVKKK